MRVLHVIDSLGSLGGGAERSLFELLPALGERGIESHVATLATRDPSVEERVRHAGFGYHQLATGPLPATVWSLRRLVGRLRPDVVHSTLYDASIVARLASIGSRVPVATSLVNMPYGDSRRDDPDVDGRRLAVARAIDGFTARHLTAAFHAITQAVKDEYVRDLRIRPELVTVVPRSRSRERLGHPGPERRRAARAALGIAEDVPLVCNVGRQEYQKGQTTLVEAFATVRDKLPDAQLVIAGRPGTVTATLEQRIAELGLGDAVRLAGHVDDVPDLLCAADVFGFSSRFEGLGGSLLEALALATPIVATDIPPVREILEGGRLGLLVTPDDPATMAEAILSAIEGGQETRERAARGSARFEERYEPERVADAMAAWLRSVPRRRPA